MPFARPTLSDLINQADADFVARLPGADTSLRFSNLVVLARVIADIANGEYAYMDYIVDQPFLSSADTPYLERGAAELGITREAATAAAGNVTFTGTSGTIPIDTLVQTNDGSIIFQTQAAATLSGGTATVAVEAWSNPGGTSYFGSAGNLAAATPLTLVTAIAGISATVTVATGGLTGGLDAETDASLRTRALARKQQPPQGGSPTDYIAWAKTVAGVTRVWVYPKNRGPGTVDVSFVMDARTNIIPLTADLTAVQTKLASVQPATDDTVVFALAADSTAVTVHALLPATTTVQGAVSASLAELFSSTTPGGATYGDGVSAGTPGATLLLEQIYQAIANTSGVTSFDLTSPSADIASATGHLAVLGTVSFT